MVTPIKIPDFSHIGSFQDARYFFRSENPLEEVWDHITRHGTSYIEKHSVPDNKDINWEQYIKYAQIRIKQAVEFRKASRETSLISSPLVLYYSFLNLLRAFMALGPEILPSKHHGLNFKISDNLLESSAALMKGTFTEYLDSSNVIWNKSDSISLLDVLKNIIELDYDYRYITRKNTHIASVNIQAKFKGPVTFEFYNFDNDDFEKSWKKQFPLLAENFEFTEGWSLIHKDLELGKKTDELNAIIREYFLPPLIMQDHPTWHANVETHSVKLTRLGYYFVGMFILSSAVRYEPELITELATKDSETSWLITRFMSHAERYFPQLILMEHYKREFYFSGSATG